MENRRCIFLAVFLSWVPSVIAQDPATQLRTIDGRVVDLRGEGVPAAIVVVTTNASDGPQPRAVADGDGFFKLTKVPSTVGYPQVRATADGFCEGRTYVDGDAVTIEVQHAVTVRGTLRGRDGKPVPDVAVRARLAGRALGYVVVDARTAGDGTFVMERVPLGPIVIGAFVDGQGLASARLHVRGETTADLRPDDGKRTRLEVTISGLPPAAERATLRLLPYARGGLEQLPPPFDRIAVDANGTWTAQELPDLEYHISPSSPAYAFAPEEHVVKAGAPSSRVEFRASPIGATELACPAVATNDKGEPVPGVAFVMRASNGGRRAKAISDSGGRLTFSSPLAKKEKAIAYSTDERWVVDQAKDAASMEGQDARSWNRHEFTVDPDRTIALRLIPACSVRGRVLLSDGRPAAFVTLELQHEKANRLPRWMTFAWATTDRDGRYHFKGLHHLADRVRVQVDDPAGSWTSEPMVLDTAGSRPELAEAKMTAPAVVEGRVLDPKGQPVPGVRVWLRDWDMKHGTQRSGSVIERITDREGRYRFQGVALGGAYLQVIDGAERRANERKIGEPFEVEAGKTYTVDIDWK